MIPETSGERRENESREEGKKHSMLWNKRLYRGRIFGILKHQEKRKKSHSLFCQARSKPLVQMWKCSVIQTTENPWEKKKTGGIGDAADVCSFYVSNKRRGFFFPFFPRKIIRSENCKSRIITLMRVKSQDTYMCYLFFSLLFFLNTYIHTGKSTVFFKKKKEKQKVQTYVQMVKSTFAKCSSKEAKPFIWKSDIRFISGIQS